MTRRRFLLYGTTLPLFASAVPQKPWHLGHYGDFYFKAVADNVYIMHGINTTKDADAHCFIHNTAFIETPNGIVLIDPGASYYVGKSILTQVQRISTKPIIAIFNTHHHSDHWFGNGAIKEAYPNVKIYANTHLISSANMQYFSNENKEINMQKARTVALPNIFVKDHEMIEIDGERFQILHPQSAHTNSDILIVHQASNIIFMGDVALTSTLSYFDEHSSILGNIAILETIATQSEYTLYVPGHGRSGDKKSVIIPYLYYLKTIKEEVEKVYDKGVDFFSLENCKIKIIERFNWQERFNFPLQFLQSHMEFVYLEFDNML